MHSNAQHLAILFHILSLIPNSDEPINFLQADEEPFYTRSVPGFKQRGGSFKLISLIKTYLSNFLCRMGLFD